MNTRMRYGLALMAVLTPVVAQAGCSNLPSQPGSTDQASLSAAAAPGDEHARAQAFVEARYAAADVRHSFRTRFGETIDCIDFFAQPGVKALAARGTPITELPAPAKRPQLTAASALSLAVFDGSPDEDGNPRLCSDTTVPYVRVTVDDIARAGGIDRYLSNAKKKAPAHVGKQRPLPPDSAGPVYAHAQVDYIGTESFPTDRATLSVWAPNLGANPGGSHSLQQTWTLAGSQAWSPSAPCAPNCMQTVEVGWTVDQVLNAGSNPTSPHLFIFSTADGYESGCYNNSGSGCVTWVGTPGAAFTPGMTLAASSASSPPVMDELTVQVTQCSVYGDCPGGWEIQMRTLNNGTTPLSSIGYYPSADFSGSFKTAATSFSAGGEVADNRDLNTTTMVDTFQMPMGSGAAATAGFGKAGYVRDYAVYFSSSPEGPFDAPGASEPEYGVWTFDTTTTSPEYLAGWGPFFYLGAPPLVPAVTSLSPSSGPANSNTVVTINGSNFDTAGGTTVTFGGVPALNVSCPTSIKCFATAQSLGESAVSELVDVRVKVGTAVSAAGTQDQFTFTGTGPTCTSAYWTCNGTENEAVFVCGPPGGSNWQLQRLEGTTYQNVTTSVFWDENPNDDPYVEELGPPASGTTTTYKVCLNNTSTGVPNCTAPIVLQNTTQCTCQPGTCESLGGCGGAVPDGCGGTITCGSCATGESCVNHACVTIHHPPPPHCTPGTCM